METLESKLTWRDGLGYLLAFLAWILLSAVSAMTLVTLRSVLAPLVVAVVAGNPYFRTHTVELTGIANSVDRFGLVILGLVWLVYMLFVEEYLRSSISTDRERRARAALSVETEPQSSQADMRTTSLNTLARRVIKSLIFPAAVLILYLLLQGVIWLIVRF